MNKMENTADNKIVIIGKNNFRSADDFSDCMGEALSRFLDNIEKYPQYCYPATGESPLFEYEEGIGLYYTAKGQALVQRWISRMEKIYLHYFPDVSMDFRPVSSMYKEF